MCLPELFSNQPKKMFIQQFSLGKFHILLVHIIQSGMFHSTEQIHLPTFLEGVYLPQDDSSSGGANQDMKGRKELSAALL